MTVGRAFGVVRGQPSINPTIHLLDGGVFVSIGYMQAMAYLCALVCAGSWRTHYEEWAYCSADQLEIDHVSAFVSGGISNHWVGSFLFLLVRVVSRFVEDSMK